MEPGEQLGELLAVVQGSPTCVHTRRGRKVEEGYVPQPATLPTQGVTRQLTPTDRRRDPAMHAERPEGWIRPRTLTATARLGSQSCCWQGDLVPIGDRRVRRHGQSYWGECSRAWAIAPGVSSKANMPEIGTCERIGSAMLRE